MQIGTPQEVYNNPANLFVATFIGAPQMNLLNAKLVKNGEQYQVEVAGAVIDVPAESAAKLAANGVERLSWGDLFLMVLQRLCMAKIS